MVRDLRMSVDISGMEEYNSLGGEPSLFRRKKSFRVFLFNRAEGNSSQPSQNDRMFRYFSDIEIAPINSSHLPSPDRNLVSYGNFGRATTATQT